MRLLLAFLALALAAPAQDTSPATIYVHGSILTGAHLRAGDPSSTPARVTAMAISNGTLTAVGSDADLLKLKGSNTEIVDLRGAFVMPGFNDAHTHIAEAGQERLTVDLNGTSSLAEMLERIRLYTASAKPAQWIVGGGWDHTKWASKTMLPTREDLDKVTAGHPAVFARTDGHIVVANSAALLAAGISATTADPQGGKIDHETAGTPTGIVRDTATRLLYVKVPPPDAETRRKALNLAIADALAHGVTSLQDNSTWDDWLVLEAMEREGHLPMRIAEWLDFNAPLETLKAHRASHDPGDPLLHLTQLKGFMDGSLGSRTAALAQPYADDPRNSGLARYEQDKLNAMAVERAAAGFQVGFHAIGDQANSIALNAFEAVRAQRMKTFQSVLADRSFVATANTAAEAKLRFRIEHAQVLLAPDFERMARLGVIASMQPSHLLSDMAWAGSRLGPERSRYAYAWRTMLDHNIPLAFGTDYPVEPITPFRGLYVAITRKNEAGTQTFHPEQRLTIAEAIYAYTQAPAYAEFRETTKGRLEPGFVADFIVLDHDLQTATPEEILTTKVLRTVVGGRTVYTQGKL